MSHHNHSRVKNFAELHMENKIDLQPGEIPNAKNLKQMEFSKSNNENIDIYMQQELPQKEMKEQKKDLPKKELKEQKKDLPKKDLKEQKQELPKKDLKESKQEIPKKEI